MDMEEAVRLSEAEDLNFSPTCTLATVNTSMFLLLFTGKKSELNLVMANLPTDKFVYWRSNKVSGKDVHRVILKDAAAGVHARMFGEENPVRKLTVGELADARNVLDIPWLTANRGFLSDRIHDQYVRHARGVIHGARHMMSDDQPSDTVKALDDLSEKFRLLLKRPKHYERDETG
jgi:hypothetical protein